MNNQELELKVKEILAIENFFDMIEAAVALKKEYKKTKFYKKTRMSLFNMIKNSKTWYTFQAKEVGEQIQALINNIDLTSVQNALEDLGGLYNKENNEVLEIVKEFQKIVK